METELQMLDEKQAARIMCVSVAALRRWRREGRGPEFTHLERCVRYSVHSILLFAEANSSGNRKASPSTTSGFRTMASTNSAEDSLK